MSSTLPAPSGDIPTVNGSSLLGVLPQFLQDAPGLINETAPQFGGLVRLRLGTYSMFVVSHPDAIQYILRDNQQNFHKGPLMRSIREVSGDSLVSLEGGEWLQRRRVLQPHFHRTAIAELGQLMRKEIMAQLIDTFDPLAAEGAIVDVMPLLRKTILRLFLTSFYGLRQSEEDLAEIRDTIGYTLRYGTRRLRLPFIPLWFPWPGAQRYRRDLKRLRNATGRLLSHKQSNSQFGSDLLSMLLAAKDEKGEPLSPQALEDETVALMRAGLENVAATMGWILYAACRYRKHVPFMRDEYRDAEIDVIPELDQLNGLSLNRQFIDEVMRYFPTSPSVVRSPYKADVIGNYQVSAGSTLLISIAGVHRHPDFWQDPHDFMPSRFANGSNNRQHRFAYLPFSAGPRQCIGAEFARLELRLLMVSLLQRYNISLPRNFVLKVNKDAIIHPESLPLQFSRR